MLQGVAPRRPGPKLPGLWGDLRGGGLGTSWPPAGGLSLLPCGQLSPSDFPLGALPSWKQREMLKLPAIQRGPGHPGLLDWKPLPPSGPAGLSMGEEEREQNSW